MAFLFILYVFLAAGAVIITVYAIGGFVDLIRRLVPRRSQEQGPEPWWVGLLVGLFVWASLCAVVVWVVKQLSKAP